MSGFEELNGRIVACGKCPRLRAWCGQVAREKRRAFADEEYWGLPVPNFGDPAAVGLIVGLAPAAHGANRTGRMFTGDRSGDWLYRALFRAGLASQPTSLSRDDGLRLKGVAVTAVGHCAPPANKLLPGEIANCRSHLLDTLDLREWRAVLCLGSVAWTEVGRVFFGAAGAAPSPPGGAFPSPPAPSPPEGRGGGTRRVKFSHGAMYVARTGATVFGSYHPSQQNTFTGKLTEAMLDEVVGAFARVVRRE